MEKNLHLSQLKLKQFRLYEQLDIQFCNGMNGFAGKNGVGKTNLLDAVYYSCMCKSYFHHSDQYNFKHGSDFFRITAEFALNEDIYHVDFKAVKNQKKELLLNMVKEDKLSQFVGKFPCVIITPDDNSIILNGSEERRRLMDMSICQFDHIYTDGLMAYNRCLQQRNALLKNFALQGNVQWDYLDALDQQLNHYASAIHEVRIHFMNEFLPLVQMLYSKISFQEEEISLVYESPLNEKDMLSVLFQNRQKDLYQQRTTRGIHTDDIDFQMNGYSLKKTGSQGQQKSYLFALKMAQFFLLKNRKNLSPILLLDDIFDKFDENRVSAVFDLIGKQEKVQVFISDTHPERLKSFMNQTGVPSQTFKIEQGNAYKI